MSTVGKALSLLNLVASLSEDTGLSEIARLAALDKATARRLLVDLEAHGFIEQDKATKRYRIGAAPVRLARIREARFPFLRTAIPVVKALNEETEETCHLSEFSGHELWTVHVETSPRANRVIVDVGSCYPLHATASGLALLAFLPEEQREAFLAQPLKAFTPHTVTDPEALRARINETRARGTSVSRNGLEPGVISTAAPVLSPDGLPVGTISIAAPEVRVDDARLAELNSAAQAAASRLSAALYGLDIRQKR